MRLVSKLLDVLLVLLLLASAFFGLKDGIPLVRAAHTVGQWTATVAEILYGVTAVLVLVVWASRFAWLWRLLLVWALGLAVTSALAPVVWAHASLATGAASGAGAAIVLALLLWGWHGAHAGAGAR